MCVVRTLKCRHLCARFVLLLLPSPRPFPRPPSPRCSGITTRTNNLPKRCHLCPAVFLNILLQVLTVCTFEYQRRYPI